MKCFYKKIIFFLPNRPLPNGDPYSTFLEVYHFLAWLYMAFLHPVQNKNGMIMNTKLYPRLPLTHQIEFISSITSSTCVKS